MATRKNLSQESKDTLLEGAKEIITVVAPIIAGIAVKLIGKK